MDLLSEEKVNQGREEEDGEKRDWVGHRIVGVQGESGTPGIHPGYL